MSEYLTTKRVAEILSVDPGKVCDLIADGSLQAVNVARNSGGVRPRWRVSEEALNRFIAARSSSSPTPPTPRRKKSVGAEPSYY